MCHFVLNLRDDKSLLPQSLWLEIAHEECTSFFLSWEKEEQDIFSLNEKKMVFASRNICAKLHCFTLTIELCSCNLSFNRFHSSTSSLKHKKHKIALMTLKVKVTWAVSMMIVIIKVNSLLILQLGGMLWIPLLLKYSAWVRSSEMVSICTRAIYQKFNKTAFKLN